MLWNSRAETLVEGNKLGMVPHTIHVSPKGSSSSWIPSIATSSRSLLRYLNDELLWAAAWIYQATNNQYYLDYLGNNGDSLSGTGWSMTEFGWDVRYAAAQVLVSKLLMQGKAGHHAAVFQLLPAEGRELHVLVLR